MNNDKPLKSVYIISRLHEAFPLGDTYFTAYKDAVVQCATMNIELGDTDEPFYVSYVPTYIGRLRHLSI